MTSILAVIGACAVAWVVFAYNRLVRLRNQVRAAWADIDVQLVRRHDLVPQLVAAVKGYASHEQSVLEAVSALRSQAATLTSPAQLGQVETQLEQALGKVFALREAYPDLKASENFSMMPVGGGLSMAFEYQSPGIGGSTSMARMVPSWLNMNTKLRNSPNSASTVQVIPSGNVGPVGVSEKAGFSVVPSEAIEM